MPYCENCGSEVNPNVKFCGNCGVARNQAAAAKPPVNAQPPQPKRERLNYYSPPSPTSTPMPSPAPPIMQAPMAQASPSMQPAPAMPQAGGEATVGVILFRKPKSLGRWDPYTGVVTNQRLIFAQMTSEMLKAAVQQSREQAKAQGKGFFGQWSDQLKATWGYSQKYLTMSPEAILSETPGNFALYNNTISEVKVKLKGNGEGEIRYLEVEIHSTVGKFEFHMDENSDFTDLLKRVYGDRVRMPFGYFSKSINIKF
ncbi:MAG: zinc ribbon domain-containing protein [Chloroflexi bacterium]|nr:zinc ribbon domain-containing protein [Chloroflexota bacterium]